MTVPLQHRSADEQRAYLLAQLDATYTEDPCGSKRQAVLAAARHLLPVEEDQERAATLLRWVGPALAGWLEVHERDLKALPVAVQRSLMAEAVVGYLVSHFRPVSAYETERRDHGCHPEALILPHLMPDIEGALRRQVMILRDEFDRGVPLGKPGPTEDAAVRAEASAVADAALATLELEDATLRTVAQDRMRAILRDVPGESQPPLRARLAGVQIGDLSRPFAEMERAVRAACMLLAPIEDSYVFELACALVLEGLDS